MTTLSTVILAGNEEDWIKECVESVIYFSDEVIVIVDSKSRDNTIKILDEIQENNHKVKVFLRRWIRGSEMRQFGLQQCTEDWILFLDADEILSDNAFLLKEYIKKGDNAGIESFSIKGHHFIFSLGLEDFTLPEHFWANRLVKRTPKIHFPKQKYHGVIQGLKGAAGAIVDVRVFHMGYVRHLSKVMKKHEEDMKTQEIHSPEFLKQWKDWHLKGTYPTKPFQEWDKFPSILKEKFKL